ncbi:unnamed protein product [Paramecium octaurelia]|uniref:non-specific serine/threonine protein kinase n=1 Tax=Paramecium octaurelia TaxID=43137 RepID=A0A8S1WT58_PAROT|nr:unnamed protein product [Paramecium octaurelia]
MLNLSNLWFAWSKQNKLKDRYEIDGRKSLGPSKYGMVIKYKEKKKDGQIRTVRVVPKTKVVNQSRFKQEINQMRYLNHENITRLIELFEDDKNLYFVLEYCDGGSLFEKILLRYYLKQSEARYLFQQIINSLNIAHRSAICQRDLRPESFHFINKDINNLDIKLIDLGFQLIYVDDYIKKSNNQIIETSRQGKLYFAAPEIFIGKLTEKSEIWASGVILHVLLTGELPFDGKDENEIYKNIQDNKIQLKTKGIVSDLIEKILQPQEKRYQIFQIQKHQWMSQQFSEEEETLNINFSKFKLLTQNNFLQKIMRGYVADQVKQGFADNLRIIFDQLDNTGSGFIKIDLIQKSLEKHQEHEEILKLLKYVQTEDGTINYLDFMNQILEKRVFVDEERIYKTFKMFDLNNKGKISNENLWEILSKLENYKYITKEYCSLLISEVDRDQDGEIEYLEFIDMFFKRV